jgi:hypothetical protein
MRKILSTLPEVWYKKCETIREEVTHVAAKKKAKKKKK